MKLRQLAQSGAEALFWVLGGGWLGARIGQITLTHLLFEQKINDTIRTSIFHNED
jgi:hypothetical protein